jgi:membrane peptidoglycan carboxypeptidase
MTLTWALTHSINTVAVHLSVMLGHGNPKAGRVKIIETAKRMGLRSPLTDSLSLPIGAAAVRLIEHTAAYATFPNLGKAVTPHAILEVKTTGGHPVWRFDRDGPKPQPAISPQVAFQMIGMMNRVVEERHRHPRPAGRHSHRGQDRHHQRLSRRLVHGLLGQLCVRRVVRQRQLPPDQPDDRRVAASDDLA